MTEDMQCTWFPDLWIKECCIAHDLGGGDVDFFMCIVEKSEFLGGFAYIFAGIILIGMITGRPVYNLWKKSRDKS